MTTVTDDTTRSLRRRAETDRQADSDRQVDTDRKTDTDRQADRHLMSRRLKNVAYAASAGLCGSSAGTFGKIGMRVDEFFGDEQTSLHVNLARLVMVATVVLANVGVWLMYTRSLRFGSTLASTGISIAANYIFTALTGVLLFSESCSILWACGTLSVMIGVILMSI